MTVTEGVEIKDFILRLPTLKILNLKTSVFKPLSWSFRLLSG